jgi:hypothetical protein
VGGAWGLGCGGARGQRGVEDTPLGENPHVGLPDGWGRVSFVGRGRQQRPRVICGAELNRYGGALREADTPCGKQPQVGAEPPSWLG